MHKSTVRELFRISIKAEGEARSLYAGLAERFSAIPEARDFFSSMASDEENHILGLESLLRSLPADELERPAPEHALALVEGFMNYSADSINKEIKTLGDAYMKTVNLEFSEINKLHEFLFRLNLKDDKALNELQSVLRSHLDKASAFRTSGADMDHIA